MKRDVASKPRALERKEDVGRGLVFRAASQAGVASDGANTGESWMGEAKDMEEEVLQRRGKDSAMLREAGMGHDGSRVGSAQSAGDSHWSASKRTSITCPSRLSIMAVVGYRPIRSRNIEVAN